MRYGVPLIAIALLWLAAYLPWILQGGIPDFRQDWTSPIGIGGLGDYYARGALSWRIDGMGMPNAFHETSPALFLFETVYRLTPADVAPRLFVMLIVALGIVTVAFLCLSSKARVWPALAGAAFLASSPFVYVQIVAGHQFALCGLALLPLVIVCSMRAQEGSWSAAMIMAVMVGVSSIQIQYVAFDVAAIAWTILASRRPPSASLFAGTILSAVFLWPLVSSLHQWASAIPFSRANVAWEDSQSLDFFDAALGLGYFTHYAERSPFFPVIHFAAMFAAIIALFGSVAVSRARIWGVVWLLLAMIGTGVKGPVAGVESWFLDHVAAASAFRELYDIVGPSQLAEGIAIALALDALTSVKNYVVVGVGALLVSRFLLFASLPQAIPAYRTPADVRSALATIAADPSSSRILAAPFWGPLRLENTDAAGGSDPFVFSIGTHQPINTQPIGAHEAIAGWSSRYDAGVLPRLGVGYVLARRDVYQAPIGYAGVRAPQFDADGAFDRRLRRVGFHSIQRSPNVVLYVARQSMVALADTASIGLGLYAANASALSGPCPSSDVHEVPWPTDIADPHEGWVPAAYWSWYAPELNEVDRSVFTLATKPRSLSHSFILSTLPGSPEGFEWERTPSRIRGPRVIGAVSDGACAIVRPRPTIRGSVRAVALRDTMLSPLSRAFEIDRAAAGRTVVFREQFDPRWTLRIAGRLLTDHFVIDGFMNGWTLPKELDERSAAVIAFSGERADASLLAAILALYAGCVTTAILCTVRVRRSR